MQYFKDNIFFNNATCFFCLKILFFLHLIFKIPIFVYSQDYKQKNDTNVYYGKASYYAEDFSGKQTANGEIFSHKIVSAAHQTWPFNTIVIVTNLKNNKSLIVRINDRGPFIDGRHIDLSKKAAEKLHFIREGVVDVRMEIIKWGDNYRNFTKTNSQKSNKVISNNKKIVVRKKTKKEIEIKTAYNNIDSLIGYCLQVGSFKSKKNAEKTYKRLKSITIEWLSIVEVKIHNEIYYRVLCGIKPDINSANELKSIIEKDFSGAFIANFSSIKQITQ